MPATSHPRLATTLRRYFYSGWAFLIPYLAVYLLYYLAQWPVNPQSGNRALGLDPIAYRPSRIPSLLHVYMAIHGIHLILGALALRSWWTSLNPQPGSNRSATRYSLLSTVLLPFTPWLLLAIIFYIPGVYLEWPSDPWEHLRRINAWRIFDTVGAHSTWYKSSYFIPYSLLGGFTGDRQLRWLDVYYTGICLLLCWQYYRLARACGLGERTSMIFVLLQALLFGNNIFSFYRYYGISSSIYAQIGAIALIRIGLEWAVSGTRIAHPLQPPSLAINPSTDRFWGVPRLIKLLGPALCLPPLIAFNHTQGIGIAGLGIIAIIVWRLIEWRRAMLLWIALGALVASIAMVFLFPRHPSIDAIYRPQGWLTVWYGFNLWTPTSPAFERSLHILGAFGLINLALGLWLLVRRNHIVGWLTLTPVLALALPCLALPFAHLLVTRPGLDNIITFHRLLLAIPVGLAIAAMLSGIRIAPSTNLQAPGTLPVINAATSVPPRRRHNIALGAAALLLVLSISPGFSPYDRVWHNLHRTPDDLQMNHFLTAWTPSVLALADEETAEVETTILGSNVMEIFRPTPHPNKFRSVHAEIDSVELQRRRNWLQSVGAPSPDTRQHHLPSDGQDLNIVQLIESAPEPHTPSTTKFLTSSDTTWITLSGYPHRQTRQHDSLILQNPPGASADVFNAEYIPVSRDKNYLLTSTIWQASGRTAANYLAVAWYDREKRPLGSNQPAPEGANHPAGWANGTYSYYGLTGDSAPIRWTQYTILFGRGTHAEIPSNAAFARFGALLNFSSTHEVQTQLTHVSLTENIGRKHVIVIPPIQYLTTPSSTAALLSGHWQPQIVPVDHAGTQELVKSAPPPESAKK